MVKPKGYIRKRVETVKMATIQKERKLGTADECVWTRQPNQTGGRDHGRSASTCHVHHCHFSPDVGPTTP